MIWKFILVLAVLFPIGVSAGEYDLLVKKYAKEYKVSAYKITRTIYCESQWENVQSDVVTKEGREESYGLSQIHLPSWKGQVTKEQALDPEFSIEFLAKWLSKGREEWWHGYDSVRDRCAWEKPIAKR